MESSSIQKSAGASARDSSRLRAIVSLTRPGNTAIVFCGVVVGASLAYGGLLGGEFFGPVLRAALSAMFVAAGANAANDVFDVRTDRINRPDRPLSSGTLKPKDAIFAAGFLTAIGLVLAITLSAPHFQIAMAVTVAMLAYNAWLKRVPLLGNIVVAVCVAISLAFGAITVGPIGPVYDACIFAFVTTLARELIKDVEDLKGDSAVGAKTLPGVVGAGATIGLVVVLLFATLAFLPVPYITRGLSGLYLIFGAVAAAFLVASSWALVRDPAGPNVGKSSSLLKIGMVAGLLALFFANAPE